MKLFRYACVGVCVVLLAACFDSHDGKSSMSGEDPVTPEPPAAFLQMVIDQEYVVEEGDRVVPEEGSDFSIRHNLADDQRVVVLRSGSAKLYQ